MCAYIYIWLSIYTYTDPYIYIYIATPIHWKALEQPFEYLVVSWRESKFCPKFMPWFLTEKNPCGHSQVPGSLRKNRDPDDQHSSLISRPSGHGPNGGTALGSSELKPVDICGSMMKSRTIHLYFYPLVMTFTVRHGKIPTMLLIGKHHLFLWAIYTMAMLVITRG